MRPASVGNQNDKNLIHHEGTLRLSSGRASDTKFLVGCASRTDLTRNISRKACPEQSRRGAKAQRFRIHDPATVEEGYQDLTTGLERRLFRSVEGLRNTQRLLKPRNPKLENVKVEELIDDRIVRRLDESGFISRLQTTYGVK